MLIIVGSPSRNSEVRIIVTGTEVMDFPTVRGSLPTWLRGYELDHYEPLPLARGFADVWVLRPSASVSVARAA